MNKFIFAFVALLAVANASPKPGYGHGAHSPVSYGAAPYAAAPSVVYQAIPVAAPAPYVAYKAPQVSYQPIAIQPHYSAPAAPPTILTAAPSNPTASASAASASGSLNAGIYSQLVVPSYSVISGVPAPTSYGSHSYGAPSKY